MSVPNVKLRLYVKVVLLNFFIAALLGAGLRLAFVIELPLKYKNVLHAHSHIAMMGWLFGALYIFIVKAFGKWTKTYSILFWLIQLSVLGMLLTFPFFGYALPSILFTTAHLLLSYVFIYRICKDIKRSGRKGFSVRFVKTALFFLFLSTLATWALGPMMQSELARSKWYYNAVQFFLHFQFNGWFIFAVIALFFDHAKRQNVHIKSRSLHWFYWLLVISCLLTYALAVTWSTPDKAIFWVNSIGVILQLAALMVFVKPLRIIFGQVREQVALRTHYLWLIALVCLIIKIVIQTLVAIPYFATISYTIHNFVIGFIHLLMLGALSTFLLGCMHEYGVLNLDRGLKKNGVYFFLAGFILSELLLFVQGIMLWVQLGFIPGYYLWLTLASALLPLGIGLFTFSKNKVKMASEGK